MGQNSAGAFFQNISNCSNNLAVYGIDCLVLFTRFLRTKVKW